MSTRLLEVNQQQVADAPDACERTRLLQDRAILQARLGRPDEAVKTLEAAEEAATAKLPAPLRLRFDFARAIAAYFGKHFDQAREQMSAVARNAGELGDAALRTECESALA